MIEVIERVLTDLPEESFVSGGVNRMEIGDAEGRLNISFPDDYVGFLEDYGSFTFFGMEILGIIAGMLTSGTLTDCVQVTEFYRANSALPANLIVIFDDNGDELHVVRVLEESYDISAWDALDKGPMRVLSDNLQAYIEGRVSESESILILPEF